MSPKSKKEFNEIAIASRGRILKVAFDLFAQQGYMQISVDAIAKKAKISKGLIYHYFKGKEEILKEVFLQFVESAEKQKMWVAAESPELAFRQFIDYSVYFISGEAKLNKLMFSLAIQPTVIKGIRKDIERLRQGWWNQITKILEQLGCADSKTEAYLLAAAIDGIGLGYIIMGKEYPIEKVKNLILEKYLSAV